MVSLIVVCWCLTVIELVCVLDLLGLWLVTGCIFCGSFAMGFIDWLEMGWVLLTCSLIFDSFVLMMVCFCYFGTLWILVGLVGLSCLGFEIWFVHFAGQLLLMFGLFCVGIAILIVDCWYCLIYTCWVIELFCGWVWCAFEGL